MELIQTLLDLDWGYAMIVREIERISKSNKYVESTHRSSIDRLIRNGRLRDSPSGRAHKERRRAKASKRQPGSAGATETTTEDEPEPEDRSEPGRSGDTPPEDQPEPNYQRDLTAFDLVGVYREESIPRLRRSLEIQAQQGNWRPHEWIRRTQEQEADKIPWDWRCAIAFLFILSRDIDASMPTAVPEDLRESSALVGLAEEMRNSAPWKGRAMRSDFHARAQPLLLRVFRQFALWSPPLAPSYLLVGEGEWPVFDRLIDPSWDATDQPSTLDAVLHRLMLLLPDVDKPKRHPFLRRSKKLGITDLAALWCLNAHLHIGKESEML